MSSTVTATLAGLDPSLGLLALSVAMLGVGPLIHRAMQRKPGARVAMSGFVLASVGGLVALLVLPPALARGGAWALGAAALGLVLPLALERSSRQATEGTRALVLALALTGLVLHALLDGVALMTSSLPEVPGASGEHTHHGASTMALALAVILHRLPVGLGVWWMVRPRHGARRAASVLGLIALVSCVGFWLGGRLAHALHGEVMAGFTAFMGGALLHVLGHQAHRTSGRGALRRLSWAGGAGLGAALVGLLLMVDDHGALASTRWLALGGLTLLIIGGWALRASPRSLDRAPEAEAASAASPER